MNFRRAVLSDCALLAAWNHELIREEGHRNPMTVPELTRRMEGWLAAEYVAILFTVENEPVAYALYREQPEEIYLRQFFVARPWRRKGLGKQAFHRLRTDLWPANKRLTVDVLVKNPAGLAFWRAVGCQDYCLTLEILPGQ